MFLSPRVRLQPRACTRYLLCIAPLPPQVALGAAHDSNLGWTLSDVEAAEAAEAAQQPQ